MIFRTLAALTLALVGLTGCSTPSQLADTSRWSLGYRLDVQQGNVITQEMLAQLQPGMDKKKVTLIMGAPVIKDTFHNNRWDYVYTFTKGRKQTRSRHVTLIFEDDKLTQVTGGVVAAAGPIQVDMRKDAQFEVPPPPKPNVLYRALEAVPFIGDKPHKAKVDKDPDEALIVHETLAKPDDEEPATAADASPPAAEPGKAGAKTEAAAAVAAAPAEKPAIKPEAPAKEESFFKRVFGKDKRKSNDEDGDGVPDDAGSDSAPPND